MRVRGNLGQDLHPESPRDERRPLRQAARQQAVVETAAVPQTPRPPVEGDARYKCEVYPTGVGGRAAARPRLAYAPRPRLQVPRQIPNLVETLAAALDPR